MNTNSTRVPYASLSRWRFLFFLMAGVGIAATVWYCLQPKAMRLVECLPLGQALKRSSLPTATHDYLIIFTSDFIGHVACYRWDGTQLWAIALPKQPRQSYVSYGFSPCGRVFYLENRHDRMENLLDLSIWRNGKLIWTGTTPLDRARAEYQRVSSITSSGHLYHMKITQSTASFYYPEGDKMVECGNLHLPPLGSTRNMSGSFSEDCKAFIVRSKEMYYYYTVREQAGRLEFTPVSSVNIASPVFFLRNNLLSTLDGALYDAHGQLAPASKWVRVRDKITPGDALLQQAGANNAQYRVFFPKTGQSWAPKQLKGFPNKSKADRLCSMTPDGQYLLIGERVFQRKVNKAILDRQPSNANRSVVDQPRHKAYRLDMANDEIPPPVRLVVYRQPGKKCAYIPIEPSLHIINRDLKINITDAQLSSDGHTVYVLGHTVNDNGAQNYLLRYTW